MRRIPPAVVSDLLMCLFFSIVRRSVPVTGVERTIFLLLFLRKKGQERPVVVVVVVMPLGGNWKGKRRRIDLTSTLSALSAVLMPSVTLQMIPCGSPEDHPGVRAGSSGNPL